MVVICRAATRSLATGTEPAPVARLIALPRLFTAAEMTIPLLIARR